METGLPRSGQWRDNFVLVDFDGDGRLDLVHGPPRKGRRQPVIFLGEAGGRFHPWAELHVPPLPYDYGGIAVGDLNGDGRLDLALASHLRGLVSLVYEDRGHFAPWGEGLRYEAPRAGAAPQFTSRRIAIADWNADGRPDLLAVNEGPARLSELPREGEAFAVFLNHQGLWESVPPKQSLQLFGSALAVGDLDADGHLDAVIGSDTPGARLLIMHGDGHTWTPRELAFLPPRGNLVAAEVADLDGDRHGEIVVATRAADGTGYCTAVDIVHWSQAGERASAMWSEHTDDGVSAIAVADLDGDGLVDIAALREHKGLLLFLGTRSGFTLDKSPTLPEWLNGCRGYDMHAADLDGDGQPELLASFAGETSRNGAACDSGGGFVAWRIRPRQ